MSFEGQSCYATSCLFTMTMVSKLLDGGVEEGCFERNSSYQRRGMRGKFGKMY